jgi:hypothetical protein
MRGSPKKDLWSETLIACQKCLEIDRHFASRLEDQIKDPKRDPLDPALWENFIEARRDLFDFTAVNLNLLAKRDKANAGGASPDGQIRESLLKSLGEMAALEEKLTAYLSENLGILKETIDNLAKGQAIFSGYASLDSKPPATRLDSRA